MTETQANLSQTFSCVALVGTSGDGNEKPMEAMIESITTLNPPGQCNEGFLRPDAVLVVTFITDEEDAGKSAGNPTTWKQSLVTAKNGDPNAIVMLGLIGDTDQPGAVCTADLADASPNLRTSLPGSGSAARPTNGTKLMSPSCVVARIDAAVASTINARIAASTWASSRNRRRNRWPTCGMASKTPQSSDAITICINKYTKFTSVIASSTRSDASVTSSGLSSACGSDGANTTATYAAATSA